MPVHVPTNSALAQRAYDSAVTLMSESFTALPKFFRQTTKSKGGDSVDDGIINLESRQEVGDLGKNSDGSPRFSQAQFWYGDRRRGQDIVPLPLGSTGFGQAPAQRPIYTQTINMYAMEFPGASFQSLEIGQTYTNVPVESLELRHAGAEAAELLARQYYYHLAGITAYNGGLAGAKWTVPPLGNLVTEMDDRHRFFCNSQTTDTGVAGDTSAVLSMEFLGDVLSTLLNRSYVQNPMTEADSILGKGFFFFCDKEGARQLLRHSATNQISMYTLAHLNGGKDLDKLVQMRASSGFQGTDGITVIIDDYVPFGQSGTTANATDVGTQIAKVRRGVLCGAKGLKLMFGQGFDSESSRLRCSYHRVHLQEDWKLFTHCGGAAMVPTSMSSPERLGSATVSYNVNGQTTVRH